MFRTDFGCLGPVVAPCLRCLVSCMQLVPLSRKCWSGGAVG
jgi:hypothetical protein